MSDTPISTLDTLDLGDIPKPYVYVTKKGEKVEFPDPGSMGMEEAEAFLNSLQNDPDSVALRKWLGDEGYEKVRADKWTLRQKNAVMRQAFTHYADIFGTPGE